MAWALASRGDTQTENPLGRSAVVGCLAAVTVAGQAIYISLGV